MWGKTKAASFNCPRCTTPVERGDSFCRACGAKLGWQVRRVKAGTPAPAGPRPPSPRLAPLQPAISRAGAAPPAGLFDRPRSRDWLAWWAAFVAAATSLATVADQPTAWALVDIAIAVPMNLALMVLPVAVVRKAIRSRRRA